MQIHSIQASDIFVSKNRQRREMQVEKIVELASSITKNGLLHPVVVRRNSEGRYILVAGERRMKAMHYIWDLFGDQVRCGEYSFTQGCVPCLLVGELDELSAWEAELEENVRRVDLTWQEQVEAVRQLSDLRTAQAASQGKAAPSAADIHEEIYGTRNHSPETSERLAVSYHLADPDVAKATSAKEAFKILKRKEQAQRNIELARSVGAVLTPSSHELRVGDCRELLSDYPKETFDLLVTDPPYGIDADQFSDSGGRVSGAHFYDDSWKEWNTLAKWLAAESFRVCRAAAHAYVFCDVDNFVLLKNYFLEAGWRVFRTPLVWVNPTAMRAPWPEQGPQRKYQICLFAVKGDRTVNRLYPDVITQPSDENLGHQAQKPVALYADLLARSARPGDRVLDPFGGTGPILPAAHAAKCRATYIERDEAAYGIALKRLEELT